MPRKIYLKRVCVIFQLETGLQQNSGCPHLMTKIFPKWSCSNEVYQHRVILKWNERTEKKSLDRDYHGATIRAHNVQMYANKLVVRVNFLEVVQNLYANKIYFYFLFLNWPGFLHCLKLFFFLLIFIFFIVH